MSVHVCWTGRFQPPHRGHVAILRRSLNHFACPHVVVLTTYYGWPAEGEYGHHAAAEYHTHKNPLTIWERFWLMTLTLRGEGLDRDVSVMVAPRHDLDWEVVCEYYPQNRIICLTAKDEFELAKAELWRSRGESVEILDLPAGDKILTTTEIRKRVALGETWQSFIAESARDYFLEIGGPGRVFGLYQEGTGIKTSQGASRLGDVWGPTDSTLSRTSARGEAGTGLPKERDPGARRKNDRP